MEPDSEETRTSLEAARRRCAWKREWAMKGTETEEVAAEKG